MSDAGDAADTSSDQADRLIATALRDHARVAAPDRLRARLERQFVARPSRRWPGVALGAAAGAALAAAVVLLVVRPAAPSTTPATTMAAIDPATEAVGDHLRVLVGRGLGVEVSDMHQVKPWFTGKLDFVPPVSFLGDDDFPLAGGDVAVFLGHKAAVLEYHRRLHAISLFVFEAGDVASAERTIQGFHVVTWGGDGFGFALVSDVNFDDLRALRGRLR